MSQANKIDKQTLESRVVLARELGYEIIVLDSGNGKIAIVYARVSGPQQAIESIYSLIRQRGLADRAAEVNYPPAETTGGLEARRKRCHFKPG